MPNAIIFPPPPSPDEDLHLDDAYDADDTDEDIFHGGDDDVDGDIFRDDADDAVADDVDEDISHDEADDPDDPDVDEDISHDDTDDGVGDCLSFPIASRGRK